MKKLLSLFLILAFTQVSAQTREELIEQFMKERRKMMEQMIQMFQDDFNNDDFFKDDFDPFNDKKSFRSNGNNVQLEEKYEDDGSISIIITPKQENMTLDIQTKDGMITIKSEMKVEEENTKGKQNYKSYSSSSFSRSISIPRGYKAKSPVAKGKGIKISLVPEGSVQKIKIKPKKLNEKNKMIPIRKQPGEQTI